MIAGDIRDVTKIELSRRDGEVIVFGGPPCQGFSTSNQRTRTKENPKNWLFLEFLRIVDIVEPEWVLFENVAGILQTDRGSFVRKFDAQLKRRGYRTSSGLLNAVDFGVPQRRTQFFMVGARGGHPPDLTQAVKHASMITVNQAIGDLPILRNGSETDIRAYRCEPKSEYTARMRNGASQCSGHLVTRNAADIVARYPFIPQGGNWKEHPRVNDG